MLSDVTTIAPQQRIGWLKFISLSQVASVEAGAIAKR
jgi:hypothetical protein